MQDIELDAERGEVGWHNMKGFKWLPKYYIANEKDLSRKRELR